MPRVTFILAAALLFAPTATAETINGCVKTRNGKLRIVGDRFCFSRSLPSLTRWSHSGESLIDPGLRVRGLRVRGLRSHGLRVRGLRSHGLRVRGLRSHGLRVRGLRSTSGSSPSAPKGPGRRREHRGPAW